MKLGVCYYPEQWPETMWAEDAQRMVALGLQMVRIGEFTWDLIEPEAGRYDWAWLDRAVHTLASAGLQIVLGTPTAAPPRWLVAQYPAILPTDRQGRVRGPGSRKHSDFSSPDWQRESTRIVSAMADRYGQHPQVVGWQIDNEFGWWDTTFSFSLAARAAFADWLAQRYGSIEALNHRWATVFWGQGYRRFDEVELPAGSSNTVAQHHPLHVLDYRRFASHEVAKYAQAQADIVRTASPNRFITHNFMGFFSDFDHYEVASSLDIATWDSYPLGSTATQGFSPADQLRFQHTGHPDVAAFNHDLYRAVIPATRRFGVMEQQCGPVNWAPYNPRPAAGMVRLWAAEAWAHGAEFVLYFRWRQYHHAQEQMHSGLNRPDNQPDVGSAEVKSWLNTQAQLPKRRSALESAKAAIALVFDYQTLWIHDIEPHGPNLHPMDWMRRCYQALRQLGMDVDIVSTQSDLSAYRAVLLPTQRVMTADLIERLRTTPAQVLLGPRSGSKTVDFSVPHRLAPDGLQDLINLKVLSVESLHPQYRGAVDGLSTRHYQAWREHITHGPELEVLQRFENGDPLWLRQGRFHYLATYLELASLEDMLRPWLIQAGLTPRVLSDTLRLRSIDTEQGTLRMCSNYADTPQIAPAPEHAQFLVGQREISAYDFAIWLDDTSY